MTNNIALQKHQENQMNKMTRLDDSLFSPSLSNHYESLANKLAKSGVIPKQYIGKPLDLFVAMAYGYQLGMPVEQAIQDIAVVNGRPCIYGDGMLAVIMNHPEFEDIVEEEIISGNTVTGYRCTVKRRGKSDYTKTFTLDMAKKAGLLGKPGPWSQYTERMLQMRARGFALRDRFPDALRGIKMREEIEDYVDGEYSVVTDAKQMTQTERVKQSYLNRKGLTHETVNNNSEENVPDSFVNETECAQEAPNGDIEPQNVEPVGIETDSSVNEDAQSAKASSEQIALIENMTFLNDFPADRMRKALNHYGAAVLHDLSFEQAKEFINVLEKEEKK